LTGALTVFTVLQAAAVSGVSSRIWETNPGLLCYYPPGPYFRNFFSSNDQNSIAAPSTAGTWSIVANQFGTSSGGLITGSGNGIAYYADTGSTLSSVNGNTFSGAISQIYFGVAADNGAPLQGSIAEILIYASTLNATDYATTLTYLKTKYSIP
jgi:hypothetical protein